MTTKDTSTVDIGIVEESTWGTTPGSPSLLAVRATSCNLKQNKNYVESAEMTAGGQTQDIIKTRGSVTGSIAGEWYFPDDGGGLHSLIEGLMRSDWSTQVDYSGTDISFTNSTGAIAASSGSPFTNVVVGQWIYTSGSANAANNGWHHVTTVTDGQNIIVESTLTDEAASATITIDTQMIRNGTTKQSYTIEEQIDSSNFKLSKGCRVGGGQFSFTSGSINTWSMDFIGKVQTLESSTADAGSGYTSAGSNAVTDANNNMDTLYEGDTTTSFTSNNIKSLTLTINGNNREQDAIFNTDLIGVGIGKFQLTGQMSTYFETNALYTKFLNDTASQLHFPVEDSAGNKTMFSVRSLKYTDGDIPLAGQNSDIMAELSLTGKKDATYSCILQIDLAKAA